ncbi:helix-turn-helix domain-containing protein [Cytobacillus firmus]|uniref:helix-turn-helix domain-containing protein n=1 Tax=Cytobacillus firmus TaxID=1399 RepID=UPI003001B0B5
MKTVEYKCRLRVILAEKEIKHGDFAKQINTSAAAFSSIVNNRTLPSFETTYKISEVLEMDIKEIWVKIEK